MSQAEPNDDPASLEDLALEAVSAGPTDPSPGDDGPIETLSARADRLNPDVPSRLRLFGSVCRMIHAHHARGRILGDLTPARLGTTEAGEPALIPPTSEAPSVPNAWTSPERVLGEPTTTADDVFALGAILYELLTGRPPIAVDPTDPDAAARAIVERVPERPSRAAPAERRRAIGTDLDAIVLEAMRKEPERRTASAAAIADDIDALLAGLPVRAGRTSEWGRVVRFARRKPVVPATIAAALLALIAGEAWRAGNARTLRRERDAAVRSAVEARRAIATAVDRLVDVNAENDPIALRRDLLTDTRDYLRNVVGTRTEVADALSRIATIDRALGRKNEAVAGFRSAIELWRRLAGIRLGDVEPAERLAEARVGLAEALAPEAAGPDADEALKALAAAGETLLALADREPDQSRRNRDLARVFLAQATIERSLGRRRAAMASARQAIRLLEELGWTTPDSAETRIELASAYGQLARLLRARDEGLEAAAASLDRAVGLLDAATGPLADSPRVAFDKASLLADLADVQSSLGSPAPAAKAIDRSLKILEELTAKYPAVAAYRGELAAASNLDAELLRGRGRREEAGRRAEEARTILERLIVERPDEPRHVAELAASRQLLGLLLAADGKTAEAARAFRSAADALEGMKDADRQGADAYALARNLSLGLSLIGVKEGGKPIEDADDPSLSPNDRVRRDLYARRAVESLNQAVARGHDDPELYRRDPALDPLRSREDFKKLLAEVTGKPGTQ